MRRAVIVIGSNYGDEGKGLAAVSAVRENASPCLNVLINGGAQRGHTVDLPDGRRHIFHHFGSGALAGAVSCADADYIVNPMLFIPELEELKHEFPEAETRVLVCDQCRVTMPYDMMINQMLEDYRGNRRHGSCGLGIFETRRRYEHTSWALGFGTLVRLTLDAYRDYCRRIVEEYIPERLTAEGYTITDDWRELIEGEGIIVHSWQDLQDMRTKVTVYDDWKTAAAPWQTIVFEAGQGLMLDEFNTANSPYLTPSRTTSFVSAQRILELGEGIETEIRYVTRTYLTRHGAGPLPTECRMEDINPDIIDLTNMPNRYQQTIRYGTFDAKRVLAGINADRDATHKILPGAKCAIVITHTNETNGELYGSEIRLKEFAARSDKAMISDNKYTIAEM